MKFTNSPLVDYIRISPNRNSNRNHDIDTITIHCVVGQCSVETLGAIFAPPERRASSNYGIGYDGRIGMYCEEKDRSWCSSSASNDHRAVTIEVASDSFHPYKVNSKAYNSLIKLVADICKRNGIKELKWKGDKSLIGQVDKQNMTVHRWFAATACPGDYLYNLQGDIAKKVNDILGVPAKPVAPPAGLKFKINDIVEFKGGNHYPSASAKYGSHAKASKAKITAVYAGGAHPYHCRAVNEHGEFIKGVYGWVDAANVDKTVVSNPSKPVKSAHEVALEVIRGAWGNGAERRKRLTEAGYDYNAVQREVDSILRKPAPQPKPTPKPVPKPTPKPAKKSNTEIAKEVIAGKWGNGNVRKQKLTAAGYNYGQVQAEVDRLMKPNKKSNIEVAREVIAGKWGNGYKRRVALKNAGYDPSTIQGIVNDLLK